MDQSLMDKPNYIYIGRGSSFGNPYSHLNPDKTKAEFKVSSRDEAIIKFKEYFLEKLADKNFRNELKSLIEILKNHQEINLVCFCKPKTCHGDIIKSFLLNIIEKDN